jgi:UDP:flavonoid glycosyltransferase YjiC (YdhE family)
VLENARDRDAAKHLQQAMRRVNGLEIAANVIEDALKLKVLSIAAD